MNERVAATQNVLSLLALSLLLILWGLQAIGSGGLLTGLGLLAALGYVTDRQGRSILLVPAGLLLGLGSGLLGNDLTQGAGIGWLVEIGCLGLGLLGIFLGDRRHTWALAFGGILLWSGLSWGLFSIAVPLGLLSLGLLGLVVVAAGWAARRRPAPVRYLATARLATNRRAVR
jgi:hypothetical protein